MKSKPALPSVANASRAEPARGKRHRLAVGEIDIAQQPAGFVRPWQHAEGRRIGDHHEIAAALHLGHAEAAARGEYRKHGPVRGVLGEQRGGDGDAARISFAASLGHHRLAAQHAVLIGKGEADEFELAVLIAVSTARAARSCAASTARGARRNSARADDVLRDGMRDRFSARWPRRPPCGACSRPISNNPASRRSGRCRRSRPAR